jgi:hypothetical protein
VGHAVAERLGYRYVDEDIVRRAADRESVPVEVVADAEQRKSLVHRITLGLSASGALSGLSYGPVAAPAPGEEPHAQEQYYRELIMEVIREVADEGQAVIVSHAASMALAKRPGVLRVLLTASPHVRASRLAADLGLDSQAGEKAMKESDAARAHYFKRFYRIDQELPTHYDVVINTDVLTAEQATELIARAAELQT